MLSLQEVFRRLRVHVGSLPWQALASVMVLLAPCQAISQTISDATMATLQARIEALERRLAAMEGSARGMPQPTSLQPSATSGTGSLSDTRSDNRSETRSETRSEIRTDTRSDTSSQPATAEDDMARALERALVREGGLLLPPSMVEIEPRWSYLHRSSAGLELLSLGGQPQLMQMTRRWDAQQAAVGFRMGLPAGLPAQTQLELLLPYASVRERQAGSGGYSSDDTTSGTGSAELGLAWQLRPASAGLGVVAALRWSEPGSSALRREAALPVSGSFRSLQASLLFVKRRDPVVFFGALSHAVRWSQRIGGHEVDPGDASGLRGGAIIALSPDTSLRLGLDLGWSGDSRIDRIAAKGSGALSGEFSTGFSFVLSPKVLLGIETGIGLTRTAPDFRIGLSLPVRF